MNTKHSVNLLHEGLVRLGFGAQSIPAIDVIEQQLNIYIDELLLFNKKRRMVNTDDRDEIVVRHVLDTLSGYRFMQEHLPKGEERGAMRQSAEIADVGSGAGFPGIPLACAMPNCSFTLIERMASRAAFLQNAVAVLRLQNADVGQYDVLDTPKEHYADIVTCRAYSPIDEKSIAGYKRLAKSGALAALYKTPSEGSSVQCVQDVCVTPLHVPFMEERERCIVSFRL